MFKRASIARVAPFATYMAFIAVADLLARCGWSGDTRSLYAIKAGAVLAVLWYFRRDYEELLSPLPALKESLLAVGAGVMVLVLWINLDQPWMTVGSSAGFDPRDQGEISWGWVVLRWCGAALIVPVMEELFWRSFLLRWIDAPDFLRLNPARVKWLSFVITMVLFGFEHTLWLAGMIAGAVYNLLYQRTGNLWSPIIAHATTNGLLGVWVVVAGQWVFW